MAANIFVGFELIVWFSTSEGSGAGTYYETTPVARLKELGFKGAYDRLAAFARIWREGQN